MLRPSTLLCSVLVLIIAPIVAAEEPAETAPALRQSLDDAWWTGPLLAASPATLPQGHILVEPYLYDAIINQQFDHTGARRQISRQSDYGSLTYLLYGLTDSTTIGLIPRFGYENPGQGSSVGVGDMTAQVSYRLSRFLDQGWLPAMALVITETIPTGKYDRLSNPNDGIGAGNYTTTLALYAQYYLWMANGRILRTRINLSEGWSRYVGVEDASVYGTLQGFRGRAFPGNSFTFDSAWEYSVTRNWVAALDIVYSDSGPTTLAGHYAQPNGGPMSASVDSRSASSDSISLAPAIEYNWTSTVGIIVGAKLVVAGRNTGAAVIPVAAVNLVF
jgi:hypothetical protein